MPDAPAPAVLYRLISASDWRASEAAGLVFYGDLDVKDGFLHLSTGAQVLKTATRYFSGRTDMLALEITALRLGDRVKYEPSTGGELFPHLYGALPLVAVLRARALTQKDGAFVFAEGGPAV